MSQVDLPSDQTGSLQVQAWNVLALYHLFLSKVYRLI